MVSLGILATFVTGVILLIGLSGFGFFNDYIIIGSLLGFLMFVNVWHVIWPNQKIVLGLKAGDVTLASPHLGYSVDHVLSGGGLSAGLWIAITVIEALQVNGLFGKIGVLTSIRAVIHLSLALSVAIYCLLLFV